MGDSDHSFQILKLILEDLEKNHNIQPNDAIRMASNSEDPAIPISIFVQELTVLEAVTKHLHEHHKLRFVEIAELLARSPRSIWGSYRIAEKRYPAQLPIDPRAIRIPVKKFSHDALSPSQVLVMILSDEHKIRLPDIADLLHRDNRTIWTMYNSGKKRLQREERK